MFGLVPFRSRQWGVFAGLHANLRLLDRVRLMGRPGGRGMGERSQRARRAAGGRPPGNRLPATAGAAGPAGAGGPDANLIREVRGAAASADRARAEQAFVRAVTSLAEDDVTSAVAAASEAKRRSPRAAVVR